ncbi:hypothetical protein [Escherichia marmotae]|nr:hypothetical protein [Escherichia marmotae]
MGILKFVHIYALADGHKYRQPHRLKPKIYWYQTDYLGTDTYKMAW